MAPLGGGAPLEEALVTEEMQEMDMRDVGDDNLPDPDMVDELEAAFGLSSSAPPPSSDALDEEGLCEVAEALPDPATVSEVAAGVAKAMAEIGVGEDEPTTSAASSTDAPATAEAVAEPEPWLDLGEVTSLGYIYNSEPRTVMRVQRGKPANSVTINCYLHSGCRLLLTEARCPDDATLKRWLFEVPAPRPGATKEEAKKLAQDHMALGKGRWGGKKK